MGFNPATGQWEPENATTARNALSADLMIPEVSVRATPLAGPDALQTLLGAQEQQRLASANRWAVSDALLQSQQALMPNPPATPYLGRQRYRPANMQKGMMALGDAMGGMGGKWVGEQRLAATQGDQLEALRQQLDQQQRDAAQYQQERESA